MSEEKTDYKKVADDIIRYPSENNDALSLMIAQTAATLHLADMVEKYGKKIAAELDYIRKRMP